MSKPYKDRIVDTGDGLPRFKITKEDDTSEIVKIEMASDIIQEGDSFGAKQLNLLLERDDDGTERANFVPLTDHCNLDNPIMLGTNNYGTALPPTAEEGRLFFLIDA